jgi:hypothetical protein
MLKVNLVQLINYNDEQLEILKKVFIIIENAINSPDFESSVRQFRTRGELTFSFKNGLFSSAQKYTNDQVFDLIMEARENPGNIADGQMDLYLVLKPGSDGTTVGYGNPGTKEIYTYEDRFSVETLEYLANHYVHEWCHKLGFEHTSKRLFDRNRDCCSVPYAIGNLIESIAQQQKA